MTLVSTAAKSGGGAGSMELLFDSTLTSSAASIDTGASGIAATSSHLLVVVYARTTEAAVISQVNVTVNGDTGASYDRQTVKGSSSTASASAAFGGTSAALSAFGASAAAGAFASDFLVIPCYVQTTGQKQLAALCAVAESSGANSQMNANALRWRSTAAVNQITVTAGSGVLVAGTRVTIYGLA